jgi:hypothetical protein
MNLKYDECYSSFSRPTAIFVSKAAHAHSAVPGGQNALSSSAFHCIPFFLANQAQLNAHVWP